MEKLLVFIPAYNCEKQVTRVLSQLLDQRIAPWVGECTAKGDGAHPGYLSAGWGVASRTDAHLLVLGHPTGRRSAPSSMHRLKLRVKVRRAVPNPHP